MRHKAWITSLFIALSILAAPAASFADPNKPAIAITEATAPRSIAASSVDDDFAKREAQGKDLEKFEGGDIVVISTTAVVIVALVVIILLLL